MSRVCTSCEKDEESVTFHVYKTGPKAGKQRSACVSCTRIENTRWYREHGKLAAEHQSEKQKKRKAALGKRYQSNNRAELARAAKQRRIDGGWAIEKMGRKEIAKQQRIMIWDLKRQPCLDCKGVFPPCVMDFDHRDPSQKKFAIASAPCSGTRSIASIIAEIKKCDLVCANCHRIRTARDFYHPACSSMITTPRQ